MVRTILGVAFALSVVSAAPAADWPQFLGANRDSGSAEKVAAWTGDLKPAWKVPVGEAHSSPVVAGGTVYAFYKLKGKEAEALAAFDAKTGERKWEKGYEREKFQSPFGAGPQGTPTVAGGRVYTYGSTGVLTAWDAKTGEKAWAVDTLKEFKAKNLFFGVATSPTVVGDKVVVMVGGKGAGIVAFEAGTGKLAWQATDDPASYTSPLPAGEDMIFLTGSHLRSLAYASGKENWSVPFKDRLNESSTTPMKAGDLIVASSVTAGSIAIKPGTVPETAWKNDKLTCYFSTPVVVGPHLYMLNGAATLTNASITLRCVETATGKILWEKPRVGRYHAAIIRTANDKLLMLDDNGFLTLVEPNEKEFKSLAKSKVCGQTWAHPALADGRLILRDNTDLICFEMK
jgi:outer membrane protein assembly factor BamB